MLAALAATRSHAMTTRTTSKIVTFARPFTLKGVDRILPPGEYRVVTDEELEPISKSSEEDNEAGELYKAEEVLSVVLPADEDATLPLYPGEEPLDEPSPRVTA